MTQEQDNEEMTYRDGFVDSQLGAINKRIENLELKFDCLQTGQVAIQTTLSAIEIKLNTLIEFRNDSESRIRGLEKMDKFVGVISIAVSSVIMFVTNKFLN